MKKRFIKMAAALMLGSVLFTSCMGSWGLTNKVYDFNDSLGNKYVNAVVFWAFNIIPVYEFTIFADAVILNLIEFWTGSNPLAAGQVQQVEGENGIYTITTNVNGYTVEKEGTAESAEFIFNQEDNTWSVACAKDTTKVLQVTGEKEAIVFLPNGETMNVVR